jgi:hypothetical protein
MLEKSLFRRKLEKSSGTEVHSAFESQDDRPVLSELLHRFRCEACHAEFDSEEELDKHNVRLQEPQPTLPAWTRDPML